MNFKIEFQELKYYLDNFLVKTPDSCEILMNQVKKEISNFYTNDSESLSKIISSLEHFKKKEWIEFFECLSVRVFNACGSLNFSLREGTFEINPNKFISLLQENGVKDFTIFCLLNIIFEVLLSILADKDSKYKLNIAGIINLELQTILISLTKTMQVYLDVNLTIHDLFYKFSEENLTEISHMKSLVDILKYLLDKENIKINAIERLAIMGESISKYIFDKEKMDVIETAIQLFKCQLLNVSFFFSEAIITNPELKIEDSKDFHEFYKQVKIINELKEKLQTHTDSDVINFIYFLETSNKLLRNVEIWRIGTEMNLKLKNYNTALNFIEQAERVLPSEGNISLKEQIKKCIVWREMYQKK
ncbi:unnamed protein product [Brachionus calyciflorus]|uniref:Uncharacterized protein n=1 Tax=Brachionus calyciflorus TaxID=104777 RepID=A0A814Q7E1_9BILA|nr:unnamed protein product [Brachionus calyciflorus]